ncbi:MAG TPA: hypothetical protein DDW71_06660 [Lactobacillus sp.]|nr:hypothetical protein [Lactobacillus sp.]
MSRFGKKALVCGAVTFASVAMSFGFSQTKADASTKLSYIPRTFRGTWYENNGYSKQKFVIGVKHMTFYNYSQGRYKKYGTYAVSKKFQSMKRKIFFDKDSHGWYDYSVMDANAMPPMKKTTVKIGGKKYAAIMTNAGGFTGKLPKYEKYDLMLHYATNHHYTKKASTKGAMG